MADAPASVPSASDGAERPHAHLLDSGSGRPLLCLHGWGASTDLFVPLQRDLGAGYRFVIPDFPGFGETAPPEEPWSVDDYVAWTVALLDRLGIERTDIVGHSFGARVAIKLAVAHPGRVGRMVLTGAAGIRPARGAGYHLRVRTFKIARSLAGSPLTPPGLRGWARRRSQNAGSRDYRNASGTMRGTFVRVVNEDLRDLLPRIRASVLLVWGDVDDETPLADGRLMETTIPDAGLVVFEGRGHYAYIEESPRFARVVAAFLGGEDAPGEGEKAG